MSRARRRERGIALLLVLWVFMVLGVIALDFARFMRDDAMAAVNFADEARGYYVALAGMNRALFDVERMRELTAADAARGSGGGGESIEEDDAIVPADGRWHEGEFAGSRWAVRMTDEGGRIALNKAGDALLKRVVTNLVVGGAAQGIDRRTEDRVDTVVNSILDWRDVDELVHDPGGAESEFYLQRRIPYRAKNGFFDSPEELLLVRGVTPELFYGSEGLPGLRDVLSVYSRSRAVNVRTAPAAVLQILLEIDAEAAADLVAQRDEEGAALLPIVQAQMSSLDPAMTQLLVDVPPKVVFVEARADVSVERNQSRIAAVAELESDMAEGVRIVRWLDRAPWERGLPAGDAERPS